MMLKSGAMSGAAAAVLAGAMLLGANAFAQSTAPSPTPSPADQTSPSSPNSPDQNQMGSQPDQSQATPGQSGSQAMPDQSTNPASGNPSTSSGYQGQSGAMDQGHMGANGPAANAEPLTDVKNAKQTLASASVQDSSGQPVGTVTTVHTDSAGQPTKIDLSLTANGQSKTISVQADQLKYDPSSNTIQAQMTADQLSQQPAASSTGSP